MSNLFIPSHAQGFASNAAESANPGLWKGLVGLWMPSLGPTGVVLRDWRGRHLDGTLTNMDPGTDWVPTEKGYALDFAGPDGGSTDRVATPTVTYTQGYRGTISFWAKMTDLAHRNTPIGYNSNPYGYHICFYNDGTPRWVYRVASSAISTAYIPTANRWTHYAFARDPSNVHLYVDGVFHSTTAFSIATESSFNQFGSNYGGIDSNSYALEGQMSQVVAHNRVLAAAEIHQLYTDPHALVRPKRRVFAAAAVSVKPWYYYQHAMLGS